MRKIFGLCFVTATLIAGSASAQSMYLRHGDASTVQAQLGGGLKKDGVGGDLIASYSYRGVFDVGAQVTFTNYNVGLNNNLKGIKVMPYLSMPVLRQGEGLPFSVAGVFGVNKHVMLGNGPVPGPDGWGVLVGPSAYLRLDLSDNLKLIPEVFVAFDFNATRHYSNAQDQKSSYSTTYETIMYYDFQALVKANVSYTSGTQTYLLIPYSGYQGAFVAGANLGMLF
jgi:hypothetical protein